MQEYCLIEGSSHAELHDPPDMFHIEPACPCSHAWEKPQPQISAGQKAISSPFHHTVFQHLVMLHLAVQAGDMTGTAVASAAGTGGKRTWSECKACDAKQDEEPCKQLQ